MTAIKTTSLLKVKSLPTYVGIVAPVVIMILGMLLVNRAHHLASSANSDKQPLHIVVANITDHSFTVTWNTTKPASGVIVIGSEVDRLETAVKDIRDKDDQPAGNYLNHFIVVEGLEPQTEVRYKIVSAGVTFDNSGQPYSQRTAAKVTPADNDLAQGKIINFDNSSVNGALVHLTLANTSPMVGLTDNNGYWMIPLSTARSTDLSSSANYDRVSQIIDLVISLDKLTSNVTLTTKNDNPAPDIILGENYNFTSNQLINPNNSEPTGYQSAINPTLPAGQTVNELSITYPSQSEMVNSQVPEFIGTGPIGKKLDIVVHSDEEIKGSITVGSNQTWRWSPSTPLTPGEHSITVSYTDEDGFVKKVTKSFIVTSAQAAENEFLPSFTATGSGQQTTPIPTVISIPTLQSTTVPTAIPTMTTTTVYPTQTPTIAPTATLAERTTVPENQAEVPTSGNIVTTLAIGGLGLLIVIAGLAFLIF